MKRLLILLAFILLASSVLAQECVSPPDGIIAWWPFDETNGSTLSDIIGNNPGITVNGPTFAEGIVDGGLRFDGGNNDYVAVGDSDLWAFGTKNFTVELWANFDTNGGGSIGHPGDIFIGNDEGAGSRRKWFFALGGGKLNFHINSPSGPSRFFPRASFSPVIGEWYHLAVRRAGNNYTLFINGTPAASSLSSYSVPNANAPLTMGQAEGLGYFDGIMDEVSIYHRALSDEEIMGIHNANGKCKDIEITTTSPLYSRIGDFSRFEFETIFGEEPFLWSLEGDLPDGMEFLDGVLEGTPEQGGNFSFLLRVTDSLNNSAEKMFSLFVVLTLPEPELKVYKTGTTAVPGRNVDYFIAVENVGSVAATDLSSTEALEPWFTFVSAEPTPTRVRQGKDFFPYPLNQTYDQFLDWEIPSIEPGTTKIIHYKVILDPSFPVGEPVTGGFCTDIDKDCEGQLTGCLIINSAACVAGPKVCAAALGMCFASYLVCLSYRGACNFHTNPAMGAIDPNEKQVIPEGFIQPDQMLVYPIHYENIGNADAANVFINDTLDGNLDISTLEIIALNGSFMQLSEGETIVLLEENRTRTENITVGNITIEVVTNYTENWTVTLKDRTITWRLLGIYLEPEATDNLMLSIKPVQGLVSGTEIRNKATIRFEIFEPMETNEVVNIIDDIAPECIMEALPDEVTEGNFTIYWYGSDTVGEIESYSIFVQEDNSGFNIFLTSSETNTTFVGEPGKSYEFICLAEDTAENVETQDPIAEAATYIVPIPDEDNDGIPNDEDKCPNTEEEQIVYGCSCKQILEKKPGEDTATNRDGCSKGIVDVFTKTIGWAKDLFE